MSMNKRIIKLIALIAAFGVLLAGYLLIKNQSEKASQETEDTTEDIFVNTYDAKDLEKLTFTNEHGSFYFKRDANDSWIWADNEDYPINTNLIENMASAVSSATAVRTVENGDITSFGFDEPTLTVSGAYSDGTSISFTYGITNSFNGNVYLRDDNADKVYLVESTDVTPFKYDIPGLTKTDTFPTDIVSDDITSITVINGEGTEKVITEGCYDALTIIKMLDFSSENCYYTDGSDLDMYGIVDGCASVTVSYKAEVSSDTSDDGGELPKIDKEFKILFGKSYDTDENTFWLYTIPESKLIYSADSDTYNSIMELIDYEPEAEDDEKTE